MSRFVVSRERTDLAPIRKKTNRELPAEQSNASPQPPERLDCTPCDKRHWENLEKSLQAEISAGVNGQERQTGAECEERILNGRLQLDRRRRTPTMLQRFRARGRQWQASPCAALVLMLTRSLRAVPDRESPACENRARLPPAAPLPLGPPPAEA